MVQRIKPKTEWKIRRSHRHPVFIHINVVMSAHTHISFFWLFLFMWVVMLLLMDLKTKKRDQEKSYLLNYCYMHTVAFQRSQWALFYFPLLLLLFHICFFFFFRYKFRIFEHTSLVGSTVIKFVDAIDYSYTHNFSFSRLNALLSFTAETMMKHIFYAMFC